MKRFITTPQIYINPQSKQKTITGKITLSKNFELLNDANNGRSPLDVTWNHEDERIFLPAGEIVDYRMQETHQGNAHTISFKQNGITYTKTTSSKEK